jgi:hypothetical protein
VKGSWHTQPRALARTEINARAPRKPVLSAPWIAHLHIEIALSTSSQPITEKVDGVENELEFKKQKRRKKEKLFFDVRRK